MQDEWHWIKVGTNPVFAAIVNGRVEAIVYYATEETGTNETGEPIVTTSGWFWFPADRSEAHDELELGTVPSADETTLPPEYDAALDAAATQISEYLKLS